MANASIDITAQVCPMTWVYVKLKLEQLAEGDLLEVVLTGEEPLKNVPRSAREDGHEVVSLEASGRVHRLLLRVGAAQARPLRPRRSTVS